MVLTRRSLVFWNGLHLSMFAVWCTTPPPEPSWQFPQRGISRLYTDFLKMYTPFWTGCPILTVSRGRWYWNAVRVFPWRFQPGAFNRFSSENRQLKNAGSIAKSITARPVKMGHPVQNGVYMLVWHKRPQVSEHLLVPLDSVVSKLKSLLVEWFQFLLFLRPV